MARKQLMVLSDSRVKRAQSCGRRFGLHYTEGLRPKRRDPKLRTGSMYHAGKRAAIAGLLGASWAGVSPQRPMAEKMMFRATGAFRDYLARLSDEYPGELDEAYGLCVDMVGRYITSTVARYTAGKENLIGAEVGFRVNVLDARGRPNGLKDTGSMDGLWWSMESECFIVEEDKTTSEDVYKKKQELDIGSQGVGYMHALMRMLETDHEFIKKCGAAGWNGVIEPGRIRMTVVRKHIPSIPTINKDGTVSTKKIATRPEIYADALNRQSAVTEKQLEVYEGLKVPDRWYAEHTRHVLDSDIERWRKERWAHSRTITAMVRDDVYPRNESYCTHGHLGCEFMPICADDIPELRAELYDVVTP